MRAATTISTLLLASSLLAQIQNPIGYPADTVRAGSGNLAPFGLSTTNTADEARWQQLIPAKYLPSTGCVITGLAVNCQSSNAAVVYTSLQITLSHTTAATLGNSFSANLPTPFQVFNGTTHRVQWSINNWVAINFTLPFPYNGTDNLVVSIQKVYDRMNYPVPGIVTHQTSGPPTRTDLPSTKYAASAPGGGGSTTDVPAFTGANPLSMRLLCVVQGTTTIASLSQPASSKEFSINTNASLRVFAATGSVWVALIDGAYRNPMAFPPIGGRLLVRPTIILAIGATSGGSSALTMQIPNDPALVGAFLAIQSAVLDPTFTNVSWTNAVDVFVNS